MQESITKAPRIISLCQNFQLPSGKICPQWVAYYNYSLKESIEAGRELRWNSREIHAYADTSDALLKQFETEDIARIVAKSLPKPTLELL